MRLLNIFPGCLNEHLKIKNGANKKGKSTDIKVQKRQMQLVFKLII